MEWIADDDSHNLQWNYWVAAQFFSYDLLWFLQGK